VVVSIPKLSYKSKLLILQLVKKDTFLLLSNCKGAGDAIIIVAELGTIPPNNGLVSGFSSLFGLLSLKEGKSSLIDSSSANHFSLRITMVP